VKRGLKVFGERDNWNIFGPNRDKIVENWRMPDNREIHNLHSAPNRMSKLWRNIREGHVARIWNRGVHVGIWYEIQIERDR
jgi:hypothetical protein